MAGQGEEHDHDPLDEKAPQVPQRDSRGRFPKGVSGNPRGGKYRIRRDPSLPAAKRRIISAVADEEIDVKVGGKMRRMTLFEANVRALALDGTKNRVASMRFIELANGNSERDLERRLAVHEMREHMDDLEQENEQLKKQVSPTSGTLVVGMEAVEKFNAKRRLDDEEGMAAAFRPGSDDS